MKINEIVRRMHPPRYTVSQAADLVGRDVDTLRRWKRQRTYVASQERGSSRLLVDLYTDDDIAAMRALAQTRKPGRRPGRQPGREPSGADRFAVRSHALRGRARELRAEEHRLRLGDRGQVALPREWRPVAHSGAELPRTW